MKVMVIGSGGREHALVWKLKQSRKVDKIFCAPGNAGIAQIARCVNIQVERTRDLAAFAQRNKIQLTVVGPEVPLARGIVDEFKKKKLKIFGPDKKGAQLESSKIFSKEFMRKYNIPTVSFRIFSSAGEAIGFCKSVEFPVVVKADGLAAGKGVIIVKDLKEATEAIENIMVKAVFGKAGNRILIESFIKGQELSIMALTDGKTIIPMLPSQDHKTAYDGDKGPNTGGMGAYCPTDIATPEILKKIQEYVLEPTLKGLIKEGITYKGVIYAGLMLTADGPKVLEYNCRFGDPETQVILPLLRSDLCELMLSISNQKLESFGKLQWHKDYAACVVMASKGYPGNYQRGVRINGLPKKEENGCVVFHSGTSKNGDQWLTAGGRVLGVTGRNRDLKSALKNAYNMVNKIKFDGAQYRRDIGFRILRNNEREQ